MSDCMDIYGMYSSQMMVPRVIGMSAWLIALLTIGVPNVQGSGTGAKRRAY